MEAKTEATLWVDVGILRQVRRPTGIPRMVQQVIHNWRHQAVPIRTCYFDPVWRIYREGDEGAPASNTPPREGTPHLEAPPRQGGPNRKATPPKATSPMRWVLRQVKRVVRRLMPGPVLRCVRRLVIWLGSLEAPFAPGDTLFLAGPAWADNPARDAIPRLRQKRGLRVALVVYDIIPLRCQHLVPGLKPVFEAWLPMALATTDLILTISEFSRQDLHRYCRHHGLSCPPVRVIRLGDEPGHDATEVQPESPPLVSDRGFALCVGTISHHKNQWLLLHVWRRLVRRYGSQVPQLVLVGGSFGACQLDLIDLLAEDEELAGHVVCCSEASDAELRWLYRHCQFTLFPSHYEGWGLPVAEGLSYGKHCICSSAASLPEIGGTLVDYHESYDSGECLRLVERAVFESGWLEERERRICGEYRVTTWADTARQVLAALRDEPLPSTHAPVARAG